MRKLFVTVLLIAVGVYVNGYDDSDDSEDSEDEEGISI